MKAENMILYATHVQLKKRNGITVQIEAVNGENQLSYDSYVVN